MRMTILNIVSLSRQLSIFALWIFCTMLWIVVTQTIYQSYDSNTLYDIGGFIVGFIVAVVSYSVGNFILNVLFGMLMKRIMPKNVRDMMDDIDELIRKGGDK